MVKGLLWVRLFRAMGLIVHSSYCNSTHYRHSCPRYQPVRMRPSQLQHEMPNKSHRAPNATQTRRDRARVNVQTAHATNATREFSSSGNQSRVKKSRRTPIRPDHLPGERVVLGAPAGTHPPPPPGLLLSISSAPALGLFYGDGGDPDSSCSSRLSPRNHHPLEVRSSRVAHPSRGPSSHPMKRLAVSPSPRSGCQ